MCFSSPFDLSFSTMYFSNMSFLALNGSKDLTINLRTWDSTSWYKTAGDTRSNGLVGVYSKAKFGAYARFYEAAYFNYFIFSIYSSSILDSWTTSLNSSAALNKRTCSSSSIYRSTHCKSSFEYIPRSTMHSDTTSCCELGSEDKSRLPELNKKATFFSLMFV